MANNQLAGDTPVSDTSPVTYACLGGILLWRGCPLPASGTGLSRPCKSHCLSCYHLASPVLRDLFLMNLPCFSGADKPFPFIKLSWLNLALGNGLSLPLPHAAPELPLVPRTYPGSDSVPQPSDPLSGLWGVGRDLSWSSQTLVLPY